MEFVDAIGIRLPCKRCGQPYEVPLRDVLVSHELLRHEGCPVAEETECPPVAQVFLADESDIAGLQRAWNRLAERVRKDGGELVVMSCPAPNSAQAHPNAA